MITGGTEAAITPMGLGGFISARALSQRNDDPQAASRPFDRDRDGFVLSEGAGIARPRRTGTRPQAAVHPSTPSARRRQHGRRPPHHRPAPRRRRRRPARCSWPCSDARLNPDDIQYINAHGTSTELGDAAETMAIKQVFGDHARKLAISSTKSMVGHLLGASGGVELIATVLTSSTASSIPTINLDTPDPLRPRLRPERRPRNARPLGHLQQLRLRRPNCCLVVGTID